jgi:hypothetical protein
MDAALRGSMSALLAGTPSNTVNATPASKYLCMTNP